MTLAELPPEAVTALDELAGARAGSPLLSVEVRHLGGEFARPRPEHGALSAIDAEFVLYAVGITPTPEAAEVVSAHLDRLLAAIEPWTARQRYLNLTETRDERGAFWSEAAYQRLRQIKAAVDPEDLIRANHPVPLAEHHA